MGADLDGFDDLMDKLDQLDEDWAADSVVWRVYTSKEYAIYIEFGRGPVEAQDAEVLRFEVDGEVVFAKSVGPAEPQPFMRPAIREAERNLTSLAGGADSVEEFVKTVALFVERHASANVTRDTGELARDITAQRVQ